MKLLKKSLAMVIAIAMVFSIISINVFADTADITISVEVSKLDVGQGMTFDATVYVQSNTGSDITTQYDGFTLSYSKACTITDISTSEMWYDANGGNASVFYPDDKMISFGGSGSFTIPAANKLAVAKFTFAIPTDAELGAFTFTGNAESSGYVASNGTAYTIDYAEFPTINIIKAFTVATVDAVADQTAELGDKVADVKAKLANLDVTVKGSAADETATLKATWDCAELADAETITTAKDYTFTGTLQGTDVVTVPEGKTATVKVTVGKIALADAMVTSTYKNIEIPQTETAATLTAEQVIAQYVGDEYKVATISKNGAFEEKDATVAWAGTGSIDTSLLTSENAGNKLTLTGTVTPKTEGSNYTGKARTADITVTVVPAEISGGAISINNPIDNGYVTANITVPASEIAKMPLDEETDTETEKEAKKAKRTISLIVPNADSTKEGATVSVEVTAEQIAAAKEADAKDLNVTLKSDKKMKELGYSSSSANKTFTVTVTVGGTQLVQKDKDGKVVPVTGEVKKATSGNAGGIHKGGSTTTTYAVTVVETKNGTATVSPEKAASGATVTVKPEPAEGYKVKSVTAVKADGTNVPVDEKAYTFTMPASAVKVTVEFEEGKDEPSVDPTPAEDKFADVADGTNVPVDEKAYTFTMPASAVKVTVEFEEGKDEPSVDPTPAEDKFADVADDFWAAKDIYTLKDAGIIGGKSATEFDPEGDVTRAEFAKMVVGLFGYKATSDAVNFEDCKAEDWFTPYVAAGVEAGVIKGVSDTEFAPNATITREDACTILGRALNKVAQSNELKFTDADKVAEYAAPYVALLSELGYVNGYEDGSFAPTNNITRAEAAKIIAGIYNAKNTTVTEDKTDAADTTDANVEGENTTAPVEENAEDKADTTDTIDVAPEK